MSGRHQIFRLPKWVDGGRKWSKECAMALLGSCYCCSLAVCCGVLGVYLMVTYVISFTIELWWILEAQTSLPVPAYLLSVGYFILFLFSALLLHGLSVKKSTYLLIWMFLIGILLGPEAGLVLYMSINHWRISTLYGVIEVTCWSCRLLVNIAAMICVQSLYTTWRDEKSLHLRLQALKMSPVPAYHRDRLAAINLPPPKHDYLNHGYQSDEIKHPPIGPAYHPLETNVFMDDFFIAPMDSPCEFTASSFDASAFDARLKPMPKIQDQIIEEEEEEDREDKKSIKSQSLLDFRAIDDINNSEAAKTSVKNKSISLNYINYLGNATDSFTQSLDRKLLKNIKKLKKLSPFLNRKTTDEVNVYQIHPPRVIQSNSEGDEKLKTGKLDRQLNRIYSHRGMYSYDDKSRKLIYYPPEFFNRNEIKKFRNRLPSNESRSSVDDDSEELGRIGDVAL